MNKHFALPGLLLFVLSNTAQAGSPGTPYPPTLVGSSKTTNKGYAGLRWDIPGELAPALILGVRRAKVETDGDTKGADMSFALSLAGGVKLGKLRLKGFTGKDDHQWELGGGYDFLTSGLFFGPSINFPNVNLGADWQAVSGLKANVMLHTVGDYDEPAAIPTCLPGDTYQPNSDQCTGSTGTGGGNGNT